MSVTISGVSRPHHLRRAAGRASFRRELRLPGVGAFPQRRVRVGRRDPAQATVRLPQVHQAPVRQHGHGQPGDIGEGAVVIQ